MYQMRQKGVSRVELLAQERELIHALELFACVPPEELDAQLAQAGCGVHVFARGEVIYGGQDFQRSLGVLLSGRAAVHKETDDGRGLAISTLRSAHPSACVLSQVLVESSESAVGSIVHPRGIPAWLVSIAIHPVFSSS